MRLSPLLIRLPNVQKDWPRVAGTVGATGMYFSSGPKISSRIAEMRLQPSHQNTDHKTTLAMLRAKLTTSLWLSTTR